jgi:two-component system nitrogen regulation response regulator GlnG
LNCFGTGQKKIGVIAMAAILVIKDDHELQGLIEKILPLSGARMTGDNLPERLQRLLPTKEEKPEEPTQTLEGVVREVVKSEVSTGNEDHIHESVIGKVERALIGMVLEEERGNQVRAARRLGINRNTLRKKMKDLQIITRVVTS